MQEQAKVDPRPALLDLSGREFAAWRHHPVSKVVWRFLEDRKDELWSNLKARFQSGALNLSEETEFRGRLNEIDDFLSLDWESVEAFYGIETRRNDDGATVSEDDGA